MPKNKQSTGKKKKSVRKVNRSSINGEFVSTEYAVNNPNTTETETIQAWQKGKHVKCLPDESEFTPDVIPHD
jgi:hypothetical protein